MGSPPKPMLCPTFAPANALRMWADATRVYVEIPGPTPHIIPYPLTDGGLSKALSLLKKQPYDFSGVPQAKPKLKSVSESMAEKLLREKGII